MTETLTIFVATVVLLKLIAIGLFAVCLTVFAFNLLRGFVLPRASDPAKPSLSNRIAAG